VRRAGDPGRRHLPRAARGKRRRAPCGALASTARSGGGGNRTRVHGRDRKGFSKLSLRSLSRRLAPRRPVLGWPARRWSPLWPARTPRPPGKPPSEGRPPRGPGGATRHVVRLRGEREIQIGLRIWCVPDDLRGQPTSSACYPTHRFRPRRSQDAPESPSSVARLRGPEPARQARKRVFISRSISRRTSRSASARRLSMPSLPRASAISHLTRPSLK
jgi:hypothetical protein